IILRISMSGYGDQAPEQETYGGSGVNAQGKLTLNAEQLQHLLGRISSDEQKDIQDTLRQCTNEVTLTRGVPFTALTLGSLYFARTRLPPKYHFGPKGWPFYVIMGIGSFTAANVFGMGTCRNRVQPKIAQLWQKYGEAETSTTNYAALRNRNRGGAESSGLIPENTPMPVAVESMRPGDETYASRLRHPTPPRKDTFAYSDTFISGTPSGPARDRPLRDNGGTQSKGSSYGDEGFS
ncbi:hypothetical protein PFISCL1PPCAC_22342, partial [Pristionchus fissidentatus]